MWPTRGCEREKENGWVGMSGQEATTSRSEIMENYHEEYQREKKTYHTRTQQDEVQQTAAETQTGIFDQRLHVYKTGICPSHE